MSYASRWPAARHSRAMRWGIAVSLLLHAALLQMFLHHDAAPPAASQSTFADMTLFLLPTPQPRLAHAQVQRLEPAAPQAAQRNSRRPASNSSKKNMAQPLAASPSVNETIHAEAKEQQASSEPIPRVDLDAAVKMAGRFAKDPNSMRDDRAVAQLKNHPLEADNPDSRLGQDIQRSARADCLQSQSSKGLLAPLFLVADAVLSKKDGGCKW
ncbi:hypothetical protein GN109_14455 [Collimonas pratensis]|uniref:hypothetical protein n=1 Tax=Collimonas pratensis TaxID=279113 RepID=UPI00143DB99B|nr:hypothetical protein [Collimonas pratensis]NKI70627.1 hypothetical protein [Collimonas pratensis]